MELTIRKTTISDLPRLKEIFAYARQFMKATNNPNQWADNYPSEELLREDIESGDSYVCVVEGKTVATFLLRGGVDPTYNEIAGEGWLNDEPYGTIHRIASDGSVKGILHTAVLFALQQYSNIRIDTHRDNVVMQKSITKEGFKYCGVIRCWSGSERNAYHLVSA